MEGGGSGGVGIPASSLGQTKRTEVRTPDSTCSQWRGISRGCCFWACKTPVGNLLLETRFTVPSNGLRLTVARLGGGGGTQEKITTDIASTWQYLLQF